MTAPQLDRPAAPARAGRAPRWLVLAVAPVVAVLALWGLATGGAAIRASAPAGSSWNAGDRRLVTASGSSDTYLAALLVGTLSESAPGGDPVCLAVTATDGRRTDVVWPAGYRLSATGEVLRPGGSVAARVGQPVSITGGEWGGPPPAGDTCPAGDERWGAAP